MRVLAIETSCDETAVCLIEADGTNRFSVLGNALLSQIDIHREFGGVYPNLAKREHAKNLVPLLEKTLGDANMLAPTETRPNKQTIGELQEMLAREPELFSRLAMFLVQYGAPRIDRIAVTHGPGLEPALWVGINFAKALSSVWDVPIVPVNHMEGHIYSSVLTATDEKTFEIPDISFPALALLISGGHTELVRVDSWGSYKCIGETRDDAVGEAFDKVARMLGLPYPGGPEISRLADKARAENLPPIDPLPRPMQDSGDLDFSFSGLKTAVRNAIATQSALSDTYKRQMAREFEDAVSDVLISKTQAAIETVNARTLIIGGGVSANTTIRNRFEALVCEFPQTKLYIPTLELTTDNAVMIGIAGACRKETGVTQPEHLVANGNLRFT